MEDESERNTQGNQPAAGDHVEVRGRDFLENLLGTNKEEIEKKEVSVTVMEDLSVAEPEPKEDDKEVGEESLLSQLHRSSSSSVAGGQPPVDSGSLSITEAGTGTYHRSTAELREHLTLSIIIISTAIGVLADLFFIRRAMEPISKNPSLIVASASAFVSLISGFGLMFDTMRQMMSSGLRLVQDNPPRSWSKLSICLSTISIVFTVITVTVSFMPKTYYYVPVAFVPTLPVVGISFYHAHAGGDAIVLGGGNDPNKDDRKRSFQLTVNMTAFSIMGFLGTLIGYHKNSSNIADHIYVKVSIYFMLGANLTGLVTLLLNRTLRWTNWKNTAAGNAIMLCLLVPAVMMVATTFLGGLATATAFPAAIAAATWYFMEYHVARDDYGQGNELKPLYTVALTAMSMSFGAVIAIFAGFLGSKTKANNIEVCVFSMASCFVSSLCLGVITFRTTRKASLGAAANVLFYLTLVLLAVAALALVCYVG